MPFSLGGPYSWKLREHLLQFSEQALHFLLGANGDAHTTFAIRTVTQGNAPCTQSLKNSFLLFSEAAKQEITVAGPALEFKLLKLFVQPFTAGLYLGNIVIQKLPVSQRFRQAFNGKCVHIER